MHDTEVAAADVELARKAIHTDSCQKLPEGVQAALHHRS